VRHHYTRLYCRRLYLFFLCSTLLFRFIGLLALLHSLIFAPSLILSGTRPLASPLLGRFCLLILCWWVREPTLLLTFGGIEGWMYRCMAFCLIIYFHNSIPLFFYSSIPLFCRLSFTRLPLATHFSPLTSHHQIS